MHLIKKDKTLPEEVFKWRTRQGDRIAPADMETRHLFYTLRMIWNHSVEEKHQLKPFQRYYFGKYYTRYYMKRAVKALVEEMSHRPAHELTCYLADMIFIQQVLIEIASEESQKIIDKNFDHLPISP